MQINLILTACARLKQNIDQAKLDPSTTEKLDKKIDEVVQKALDPAEHAELESILQSDQLIELDARGALHVMYNKLSIMISSEASGEEIKKIQNLAKEFLKSPSEEFETEKLTVQKRIQIKAPTEKSMRNEKFPIDLSATSKNPPFDKIPHLREELHREISPETDFEGEYQEELKELAKAGYTTKKDLLNLSERRMRTILDVKKDPIKATKISLLHNSISESLKKIHQAILEQHLDSFFKAADLSSLKLGAETTEDFLATPKNRKEFKKLIKNLAESQYDEKFELSNTPLDALASKFHLNEEVLKRLNFEIRVQANAQVKINEFEENFSTQLEKQTSLCWLFDSLAQNFFVEKGIKLNKEDAIYFQLVFQKVLDNSSSDVQAKTLPLKEAAKELESLFFRTLNSEKSHYESFTPKQFLELPEKSLPNSLNQQLRKEIENGTWLEGQKKVVEFPNILPDMLGKLETNLKVIFKNPSFKQALQLYFESLL